MHYEGYVAVMGRVTGRAEHCARTFAALVLCGACLVALHASPVAAEARLRGPRTSKPELPALESLLASVERGAYAEAEPGLRTHAERDVHASVGLVRVYFQTGRYAEARAEGQRWAAALYDPEQRAEADTWVAQAWLAEGVLDAAERTLRATVAAAPTALGAQWLLGRLLWDRGQRLDAVRQLEAVIARARGRDRDGGAIAFVTTNARAEALAFAAMAARTLGRVSEAHELFRASVELDRARAETHLEWAQLFLDKYDLKRAAQTVQAVLAINPDHPQANVLCARIAFLSAGDTGSALASVQRALEVNPRLSPAYVLRASMALREMDIPLVEEMLGRALAINPADLDALSVRAAARFLDDDTAGFEDLESEVLSRNPLYARFYVVVAEYAEWEHRYPEMIEFLRRALRIDPGDTAARASLGLGLLRMGEESAGLAALHKAWQQDRSNIQVWNTLNLFEDSIRREYTQFTAGRFRIRLHKTERKALSPYLVPLLQRAYDQLRERWEFKPVGPLRVELYADRAQFSVRTTGLPNTGVQGVSFGKLVTGLSPRGGPFNWGQIVWHELSHVFHLQLSKNRVPRWFTEGLAEYETALARPEWKREDDAMLWQALRAGRLPPLTAMNRAFTQARTPDELMAAYFFAYRAVQYIATRFGFPSVRKLLVAFGEGRKFEAAVPRILGVSLRELDRDFRNDLSVRLAKYGREFAPDPAAYADAEAAAMLAARAPSDPAVLAALSLAELKAGNMEAAAQAASSSLKLAPNHRLAHFARARVALAQGDARTAERSLLGIVESGADGYTLRLLLARGALARGSLQLALVQAQAAVRFDPERLEAHRLLLELAGKLGDEGLALRALRALSELDQHDSTVHAAYLALLRKQRAWSDMVLEGETALYIAPESPALHVSLGEAYIETGAYARGLVELDRALALGSDQPGQVRLLRARALLALKKRDAALRELKRAVASDPSLTGMARSLLAP